MPLIKRAKLRVVQASAMEDVTLYNPKTAFIKHDIGKNLIFSSSPIDVVSELESKEPSEWVIFRARAIDAGGLEKTGETIHGPNDNGDYFSEEELLTEQDNGKKTFETFVGCPIFTNHQNDDVEKARGRIVNSFYDLDNHCVYVDAMVDAKAYPELARGLREGYISDVSMGSLHESSRVLMYDGTWKRHDELKIGDLVITHTGQIQPITMVCRSNEPIKYYEIDFIGSDKKIKASHDHPFFIIKNEEVSCSHYPGDNKSKCTPLGIEKNKQCKNRNCDFSRGRKEKEYNPFFEESEKLSVGDYLLTPIDKWFDIENQNADIEFSTILGYYLAEGNKNGTTGIYFNFGREEHDIHEDLIKNIHSFCSRQGYNYRLEKDKWIKEDENRSTIVVFCKELFNLISEFSDGTALKHNKRISKKEVFNWSKEVKLNLIGKMINGDGCNVKTNIGNGNSLKFYSNSEILADQFNDLCLSCGIVSRKSSILREKYSDSSLVKSKPNREFSVQIGRFDAEKLQDYSEKYEEKTITRTMLSNRRFIWNGYLCSPIKSIKKKTSGTSEYFYHIEVGGNENKEINSKSDHTYIADGIAVHNCSVKYSDCSVCGHRAASEDDFCDHVKNSKGKTIDGKKVYEINHGIKFIELSAVTDGACENCTIQNCYTGEEFIKELSDMVKKSHNSCIGLKAASLKKESGGEDLDKLNQALDLLKEVAEKILSSKDVDFDFLEETGKLLSDLQTLIVDLVEAGFANDPSNFGPEEDSDQQTQDALSGEQMAPQEGMMPETPETATGPAAPVEAVPNTPVSSTVGEKPMITPVSSKKDKNIKYIQGLKEIVPEIKSIAGKLNSLKTQINNGEEEMNQKDIKRLQASNIISQKFDEVLDQRVARDEPIIVSDGPYSVNIDFNKGIRAFAGKKEVASLPVTDLGEDILKLSKVNPSVIAGRLIEKISNKFNENGEIKMGSKKESLNLKEALKTNPPPVEEIQEGQLGNLEGNFSRKNDEELATGQVGVTTEKQLNDVPTSEETGKGDWNRVRPEGVEEDKEITEGQMENTRPTNFGSERKNPQAADASGQLGEIQEGQLKDSEYSQERWDNDQRDGEKLPTTEKQFEGKDRQGKAVDEVQEGQLDKHRQGKDSKTSSDASPHQAGSSERLVEAFLNGLANVVLANKISPKKLASLKVTKAGLMGDRKQILKKAQLSQSDVIDLAENAIIDELGDDRVDYAPEIEEAISVLFEDPDALAEQIGITASDKIKQIQEAAENKASVETVEDQKRSAISKAWKTKTASKKEITVTRDELAEKLNMPDVSSIDEKAVKDYIIRQNNAKSILNFYENADGSFSATVLVRDQSGIGENGIGEGQQIDQTMSTEVGDIEEQGFEEQEGIPVSQEVTAKLKEMAMKKKAQGFGTTMPPAGGQPAGGEAPAGPVGGADPGTQNLMGPGEDMGGMEGMDENLDFEEEDTEVASGEAKPFGSICPTCGSNNVDIVEGKFKCNDCPTVFEVEVNYNILNPEEHTIGFKDEGEEEGEEEFSEGEDLNTELQEGPAAEMGAGAAQPAGAQPMGAPMASAPGWIKEASLRFDISTSPEMFTREKSNVTVGNVCPQCGLKKVAFKNSEGICANCGCKTFVEIKKAENKNRVKALLTMKPNLERSEEKNKFGGYAKNAECDNCDEIGKAIHKILSEKKQIIKSAAALESDPWMACMADQVTNGYCGDDSITICASIRDLKMAQLDEDYDEDEEKSEEKDVFNPKDKVEDEVEDEVKDELEDNEEEVIEDDVELEEDLDEENEDDIEFEEDLAEEAEDEIEFEEDLEDEEDNIEFEEDLDEDIPEEEYSTEDVELEDISTIKVTVEDSTGKNVEIIADEEGIVIEEENAAAAEAEEGMGEEDEADMIIDEGGELPEDEIGEINELEVTEIVTDDDIEDEELEDEEGGDLAGIFSDGLPEEEEELEEEEEELEDEEILASSFGTSEFLREAKIGNLDQSGGSTLDMEALKKSLGIKEASMPLDTEADVPRSKEQGIREDGDAVNTPKTKNTAKQMHGTAAGSTVADDDVVQGSNRGVEQIKPGKPRQGEEIKPRAKKAGSHEDFIVEAQTKQTEPVDSISDEKEEDNGEDTNVPRDESKAKPEINVNRSDVKNPKEVRTNTYEKGQGGKDLHTDVVPRDSSGDGIGGESVTFEDESGDDQTSGNPDDYIQEFQDENQIEPTSAVEKDNHATTGTNTASRKKNVKKAMEWEKDKKPTSPKKKTNRCCGDGEDTEIKRGKGKKNDEKWSTKGEGKGKKDQNPTPANKTHGAQGVNTASIMNKSIAKIAKKAKASVEDFEGVDFGDTLLIRNMKSGESYQVSKAESKKNK